MIAVATSLAFPHHAWSLLWLDQFRETEVENLRVAITRDHDVVGLQIAMHDARGMSFGQSFGHVLQVSQQLLQFGSVVVDLLAERDAFDELHRDEVRSVALTDFINVRDVRMIERGGGPSLPA